MMTTYLKLLAAGSPRVTKCAWLLLCLPAVVAAQTSDRFDPPPALVPLQELNQNVLPSWLQFNGQYRNRFEEMGHVKFGGRTDAYDLSQLRLMMIITPVKWLQFVGETQDARVFFNGKGPVGSVPPYQDTFDIRQAYVKVGSSEDGWADVLVGRQVLSFADERLLGPVNWVNQGRAFDAARVDVHHANWKISAFASSVVLARDGVIDHHYEGNNFYGAFAEVKRFVPGAEVDPFVFWRVAPAGLKVSEDGGRALNEVTAGLYWKGTVPGRFDYEVEMAKQEGSIGSSYIDSWAGHWKGGRTFDAGRLRVHPFMEGNYASGTKTPGGRAWRTFDQLYGSPHDKLGFADQVGWRNIKQVRAGLEETVARHWRVKQTYEDFWLAEARDAFYAANGAVLAQSATGAAGTHVGQEFDAVVEGSLNRAIDVGFGIGHFFTGQFLQKTTAGKDFNYPFFYTTYHFTRNPEY